MNDDFASFLERLLQPENEEFVHSPMFVFADPFGYGGLFCLLFFYTKVSLKIELNFSGNLIPMRLFKQLMQRQDGQWLPTEVFITVMDGFARRFISDSRKSSSLNALMGDENWHHLTEQGHLTPAERRNEFIELYISNLKRDIDRALTLKFGMRDGRNRHIYHLIYVTCHIKGIKTMKPAMWRKTQTSNEMVFSEWVENRNECGAIDKDEVAKRLYELIRNEYRGVLVPGNEIDDFIWLHTPYISNVKDRLKKLLKSYAMNTERAFEKIVYRFPHIE